MSHSLYGSVPTESGSGVVRTVRTVRRAVGVAIVAGGAAALFTGAVHLAATVV